MSDYSSKKFRAIYDKEVGEIWRSEYPEEFEEDTKKRIEQLKIRENDKESDKVKIEFLISRLQDSINQYHNNMKLTNGLKQKHTVLKTEMKNGINIQNKTLLLSLKSDNKNGGLIHLVFDISEIDDTKHEVLDRVIKESLITILLSIIILGIVSAKITNPINRLSTYISGEFSSLDYTKVPEKDRNDEIGVLSRSFALLLEQMKNYVDRLEHLSKNDPLTGLYNRRAFDDIFLHTVTKPHEKCVGLLYIDIDNFKKYNDFYGHNDGDVTLQKVAKAINDSLQRKGDYAFRLGGEEFAVIISVEDEEEMIRIAERIREHIMELGIEHVENPPLNIVTISIGAFLKGWDQNIGQIDMLQKADSALYNAKQNGRNRVMAYKENIIER